MIDLDTLPPMAFFNAVTGCQTAMEDLGVLLHFDEAEILMTDLDLFEEHLALDEDDFQEALWQAFSLSLVGRGLPTYGEAEDFPDWSAWFDSMFARAARDAGHRLDEVLSALADLPEEAEPARILVEADLEEALEEAA